MTSSGHTDGIAVLKLTILVLSAAGVLALCSPRPVDAQGVRVIDGSVARPVAESWTRMESDPRRFHIRPGIAVDPKFRTEAATGLISDRTGTACSSSSSPPEARGCETWNEVSRRVVRSAAGSTALIPELR